MAYKGENQISDDKIKLRATITNTGSQKWQEMLTQLHPYLDTLFNGPDREKIRNAYIVCDSVSSIGVYFKANFNMRGLAAYYNNTPYFVFEFVQSGAYMQMAESSAWMVTINYIVGKSVSASKYIYNYHYNGSSSANHGCNNVTTDKGPDIIKLYY